MNTFKRILIAVAIVATLVLAPIASDSFQSSAEAAGDNWCVGC